MTPGLENETAGDGGDVRDVPVLTLKEDLYSPA